MADSVAKATVALLARAGVRHAYTVPGESFLGLLDEFQTEPRIALVSTRHESGAAFMAEAEAKLTGLPAVALASRGPGAANLSIGVHTAMQDQTPMLVILGQVESGERGREAFQEVELAAFYAPICKWSAEARTADEVPALVAEGLTRALAGRPGPVAISVPADFWEQAYDRSAPEVEFPQAPEEAVVERAAAELARILDGAERPVVIAGAVGRDELRRAAEAHGLGVYVAFRRQDRFAEDHPLFLGHLGLGVPADVSRSLAEADVVVVAGTRLDAITSQDYAVPRPEQRLVMVGRELPLPRHEGPATVLDVDATAVLGRLTKGASREWTAGHEAAVRAGEVGDVATEVGVHPAQVVRTLRGLVPDDTVVTNDAGNFSAFYHRYWKFAGPHRQLGPCNGAMGYAVPAAVAAKLSRPHSTVVAFVGDGGVLMTGQEIETAVRLDAPIVVVVFRNGLYGTIAMHQAREHGRLAAVDIGELDLAQWARGLGAIGLTLDRPSDTENVLRTALACGRPCVVDVRTDPDVIAPNRRLSELT
ncbi:thiamine pyrophosphate-dependent enzyme [Tenggerimyces flavus]|uniref:Thiamine pyrophosphate-dependent enzyme n=1 Tax=Tenggerimyces flavus TaxID=1708749 RepID=A0ABV7YI13_9ACTN|nr:thiamine pyrophosphate-dependent enzyme [Tenggerimyces flavus]MBM7786782.1 acetolactate synthase-1/2/3 large subunit [Tenggerimyces flavus]